MPASRTFVIGDIHGAYLALKQCLERASFDYENDFLICLGDVCDGWPETKACIDELLKIKNHISVLGNHDFWALGWMQSGLAEDIWLTQGGKATVQSYEREIPREHVQFLARSLPYYLCDNRLFVHAGINPRIPLQSQDMDTFLWDRQLAKIVLNGYSKGISEKLTGYDEVYVGHTPISYRHPVECGGVWLMDTGAGWSGVLSLMDIDSKEIFTSDPVPELYPGIEGRKKI